MTVFTVLGIVFIVLKLIGVIAWSWIWALCPFWIGIVGYIIVMALLYIILEG